MRCAVIMFHLEPPDISQPANPIVVGTSSITASLLRTFIMIPLISRVPEVDGMLVSIYLRFDFGYL